MTFFQEFDIRQLIGAFIVLLAICDVPGNLPIVLNIQKKGIHISARRAFLYSLFLMVFFFYGGEAFLHLFGLDISSFAIAGALIIFLISIEMILDVNLFCEGTDISSDATLVPVVFPLFIGAGVITTLLSIRSQYADINVLLAAFLNCVMIYATIKLSKMLKKYVNQTTLYVIKKFFGMVLLAISVKLFITNITILISSVQS